MKQTHNKLWFVGTNDCTGSHWWKYDPLYTLYHIISVHYFIPRMFVFERVIVTWRRTNDSDVNQWVVWFFSVEPVKRLNVFVEDESPVDGAAFRDPFFFYSILVSSQSEHSSPIKGLNMKPDVYLWLQRKKEVSLQVKNCWRKWRQTETYKLTVQEREQWNYFIIIKVY